MSLPAAALHVYCMTIFDTGSRTLAQFQPAWQEEIIQHAINVEKYDISVYDKTLKAGRITQAEYDKIVALMPPPETPIVDEEEILEDGLTEGG